MGSVMMDHAETRTMESMAEMADRMSKELRSEMHNAEVQLNNWVAEREQRLAEIQSDYAQTMEARAAEVVELRKADKDTTARRAHCAAVVKKQEEQLQEEVKRLEELRVTEREEMPAKLEVLGAEHQRIAKNLEAKQGEMLTRRHVKEEELSVLGKGVLLYRRLGLEFEGGDTGDDGSMKCLRLVFRQISRQEPERPFVIAVFIDDNGRYVVPECFPALATEDLDRMLVDVNESNDFAKFVSRVRRRFVSMAEAGL
ncbi:unnamed protein product [Ectocarpus sp. CCAP 1310/34]|nr:unnamed protein product [Ectocarpus sp. CCAP 1310/34]